MILSALAMSHPKRNLPLREIAAECRNLKSQTWRSVATWRIGGCTYNQLRGPWLECNEFRTKPPMTTTKPPRGRPPGPRKVSLNTTVLPQTQHELERRRAQSGLSIGQVIDSLVQPTKNSNQS